MANHSKQIELKLTPQQCATPQDLNRAVSQALGTETFVILKKSLDARSRQPHWLVRVGLYQQSYQSVFNGNNVSNSPAIHIIGAGPAGYFAALQCIHLGYKPIIIERGKAVRQRRRDLAILNKQGIINPDSNYCFGEGGAGTYSDGKLYTRSNKRGQIETILGGFVQFGANQNILYEARPHIGTNKLPAIMENMHQFIVQCGGEVHFNCKLIDLELNFGKITKLLCANGVNFNCQQVLLATGHSAHDIYRLLYACNIKIEAKPFALGVRVEHAQASINAMQYGTSKFEFLPPASYNLVEQVQGCGVFSFCMCPGGIIAPASTNMGQLVVNGWSPSKRNGSFANSGFVTQITPDDWKSMPGPDELKALEFQQYWEKQAWSVSNSLVAPAQRIEDFIQNKASSSLPSCSYIPGVQAAHLGNVLPAKVQTNLRQALVQIGNKKKYYRTADAIMVGTESRTSSPVRIPRLDNGKHPQVSNLFPCAEGAGYAGGILSAAMDGINSINLMINNE